MITTISLVNINNYLFNKDFISHVPGTILPLQIRTRVILKFKRLNNNNNHTYI